MKKYKKLIALSMMTAMLTSPAISFADSNMAGMDNGVLDSKLTVPAVIEQRELTKRDLEAIDYAKAIMKDYFGTELKSEDYILDVFYSSDYNDEQFPKDKNFRENISVSFMPKSENGGGGAYVAYYEDNKEIISLSNMNIDYEAKRKMTKEKGHEIAKEFLKDKTDLDLSQFTYKVFEESPYNQEYVMGDYYYQRVHEGIEYDGDFISVTVDLSTGKVVSFYQNYTKNLKFPDATPKLTAEEALKIAKEKFTSELKYVTSPSDEKRAIPVYIIDTAFGDAVDAHTKNIYYFGGPVTIEKFNMTPDEVSNLTKDIKPIEFKAENKGQAVEAANMLLKEVYGVELTPKVEYSEYDPNNVYVTYKDTKAKLEYYVSINISDNKVLFMGRMPMYIEGMPYDMPTNQKPVINYKQAYEMAIKELAKIAPEQLKQVDFEQVNYVYDSNPYTPAEYYFTFPRKVESAEFQEQFIDIRINGVTKTVESMGIYWDDKKTFDSLEGLIKPEQAMEKFLSDKSMQLRYTLDYNQTQKTGEPVIKLIYSLVSKDGHYSGSYIDAKTGKYIDYPVMYAEPAVAP